MENTWEFVVDDEKTINRFISDLIKIIEGEFKLTEKIDNKFVDINTGEILLERID